MSNLREIITRLHPDFNGGDSSRVDEFTELMQARRKEALLNRICPVPGCGKKIPKIGQMTCSQPCSLVYAARNKGRVTMKDKMLVMRKRLPRFTRQEMSKALGIKMVHEDALNQLINSKQVIKEKGSKLPKHYHFAGTILTACLMLLVVTGCESPSKTPRTPPTLPAAIFPPMPVATIARREAAAVVLPPPPCRKIEIGWLHESVDVENECYNLYSSTSLAVPRGEWGIYQIIAGTNRTTVVTNDAPQRFFFITASNCLLQIESDK